MHTNGAVNTSTSTRRAAPLVLVFAALFIAYQLPEGLGGRILHSMPVQAFLIVMFLPVAWLCGRAIGFGGLDAWYLNRRRGWITLLAACFALSLAAKAAALGVGAQVGVYKIAPGSAQASALLVSALGLLPYTFFSSIAEDIVTRGFLMRALPVLSKRWLFVPASAALYVLNHIYRLSNGPLEWLMLFCFGLAYAAALYYSGSLWAAVGLHWGWNFAGNFADNLAKVDVVTPAYSPLLSAATHLVMLGIVALAAHRLAARPAAMLQDRP